MKDPTLVAQKWANNLGGSSASIKAGVQAVQVSPMEKAAANPDGYVAGVQRAVSSGKWQRGLRRGTLASWQQSMLTKGLQRIATGATAAIPKMQAFMQQWLPYEDGLKQKLAAMPRGTIEQNKARAMAAIDYNAAFQRQQ